LKTKLKIKFVDFWPGFNAQDFGFLNLVSDHYDIEYTDKPDLIVYSCFGTEFLKYNCPRIFYSGENIRPDFKFCDFAFTFDYNDDKRHFRLPLFRLYFDEKDLTKVKDIKSILDKKKGFCSFVISNYKKTEERVLFFHELSKFKEIASGGKYANNVGGPVANKRDFISKYLFNIAFENSSYPGYTTEKIAEPWVEGCIPIYWGDPEITKEINPDCFINMHDYASFDAAIAHIKEVDASPELQTKYLSAPFFKNNEVPEYLQDEVIAQKMKYFIKQCLEGLPKKAATYWDTPYYYLLKFKVNLRHFRIVLIQSTIGMRLWVKIKNIFR